MVDQEVSTTGSRQLGARASHQQPVSAPSEPVYWHLTALRDHQTSFRTLHVRLTYDIKHLLTYLSCLFVIRHHWVAR